ncbi:hypothetical protein ACFQAT_06635 [Undibacterium arcticum]|uniref:hypothetical protein n=1 Tax=Undibacterium arcticum TaxID=1762892 RepID=UPI0036228F9E
MIQRMKTKYRFTLMLALLFGSQLVVIGAIFLSLALDMEAVPRGQFGQMLVQRSAQLVALALFVVCAGLRSQGAV